MATSLDRSNWIQWLENCGAGKFFDAFVDMAQDAKGHCQNCGKDIYLDIVEGGGVPDWKTGDGDYGCNESPEATNEGVGGHTPAKL